MQLENSDVDTQQLVQKAVAGDKNAFGDLYLLFLQPIYRYIYYRVGQQAEAEDLAELVFLKVWEALDSYEYRNIPFEAWLYRIARNAVIDNYRTRKNTVSIDEQWFLEDSTQGPESLAIFSEQGETLREAMDRLDADYQEILILRFVASLSHAEAAVAMGRSEGATRALQHRALVALRDSYHQSQQGL